MLWQLRHWNIHSICASLTSWRKQTLIIDGYMRIRHWENSSRVLPAGFPSEVVTSIPQLPKERSMETDSATSRRCPWPMRSETEDDVVLHSPNYPHMLALSSSGLGRQHMWQKAGFPDPFFKEPVRLWAVNGPRPGVARDKQPCQ